MTRIRTLALTALIALVSLVPAVAQDTTATTHTVAFDGLSFTFASALGSHVAVQQFAGDPADMEQPGGAEAPHTEFFVYSEYNVLPMDFVVPVAIRVYNTADLPDYEFPNVELTELQSLLETKPDLAAYMVSDAENASLTQLPYLPVYPAGQVIRARAEYLENESVRGVRYLTIYRQDVSPFLANEFLYTFQGLSADGTKYISVVAHLDTALFPSEIEAIDPETFMNDFAQYLNDSTTTLNDAAPADFTPDLTLLDALVQSITVPLN